MSRFHVRDEHQVIVPIRFVRAGTGASRRNKPELDDRGYEMGRTGRLTLTDAKAPMVGLMNGHVARIKVLRDEIAADAPLFVTATEPSKVRILETDEGDTLTDEDHIRVSARSSRGSPGKIQVRLGNAEGPVLGELEPHIFGRRRIPVTIHNVRIDSASTTGTRPNLAMGRIMRDVRAIWWPCGIDIRFDPSTRPIVNDNIRLSTANQVNWPDADAWAELKRVLALQRTRLGLAAGTNDRSLNLYVIPRFHDPGWVGIGVRRSLANSLSTDSGIFVVANGVTTQAKREWAARVIAHEIGHFFALEHVANRHATNPVKDTFGRRSLMYPIAGLSRVVTPRTLARTPRVDSVGYGDREQGCLITLKDHQRLATDAECSQARRTIRRGNWF